MIFVHMIIFNQLWFEVHLNYELWMFNLGLKTFWDIKGFMHHILSNMDVFYASSFKTFCLWEALRFGLGTSCTKDSVFLWACTADPPMKTLSSCTWILGTCVIKKKRKSKKTLRNMILIHWFLTSNYYVCYLLPLIILTKNHIISIWHPPLQFSPFRQNCPFRHYMLMHSYYHFQ